MKAVHLLLNSGVPEDLRDYNQTYDVKGINNLLNNVARLYPDKYDSVSKHISDIGRNASYIQGETITLDDLEPVFDKKQLFASMRKEIAALPRDKEFITKRREIFQKYNNTVREITAKNALANRNNIALSVLSGARGKDDQMKAMIGAAGTYSDYKDEPIDVYIEDSFSEGVSPTAMAVGSFGARSAVVSTKSATAKGGDFAKQVASVSADMVIREDDCGSTNGISLEIGDKSLKGRVLAKDAGGYKAGTLVTRDVLNKLQKSGVKNVIARSAITCGCGSGLCSKCVGRFYNGGRQLKIGDMVGLLSATTTAEPITQMALNSKHTAGMTKDKRSYAGLAYIQQFSQSPEAFKDKATLAQLDGKIDEVREASQGGHYVRLGNTDHYVPAGHDVSVKVGDVVEQGDQLAEGLADPEEVIQYKGIGAGRKYYADRLNQILADSGVGTDKRNTEILARAAVRHVMVDDDADGSGYLPGDIADYNSLQSRYKAPETSSIARPSQASGKYLQAPAMHYTIGTRITPTVAKDLENNGYGEILVDDSSPKFKPEMIRLRTASHESGDWLVSASTSHIKSQLNEASVRGDDTNVEHNPDYRPRLAFGKGFGDKLEETGEF